MCSALVFFFFFFFELSHWDFSLGNLGHLSWKSQLRESCYPTYSACWVFQCFHNPPDSDMDYRIFKMHMWSFCMHTHMGPQFIVSPERLLWGYRSAQIWTPGKRPPIPVVTRLGNAWPQLWRANALCVCYWLSRHEMCRFTIEPYWLKLHACEALFIWCAIF